MLKEKASATGTDIKVNGKDVSGNSLNVKCEIPFSGTLVGKMYILIVGDNSKNVPAVMETSTLHVEGENKIKRM